MTAVDDIIARKTIGGERTFTVIVTGSRDWPVEHEMVVWVGIADVYNKLPSDWTFVVRHGDYYRGADRMAKRWTQLPAEDVYSDRSDASNVDGDSVAAVLEDPYQAYWSLYGRAAGPLRNQAMVDAGADLVLAFPLKTSVGTLDCVRAATLARVPVRTFRLDGTYTESVAV